MDRPKNGKHIASTSVPISDPIEAFGINQSDISTTE